MATLWQDLKYGLRMLAKNSGFTVVAIITLALGIGAATAIFSVVNGVLLQPLPFPNSSRLVIIREDSSQLPGMSVSYPDFRDWQRQQKSFSALAIYRQHGHFNLTERTGTTVALSGIVSAGFLKVLGVSPLIGRGFSPQDDHLGAGRTVILSFPFWQQHFGGDRGIVGKSVTLNDKSYTVIGVLPRDFWFFHFEDVYVPQGLFNRPWRTDRGQHDGFAVVGRLKSGVTLAQARAEMDAIEKRLGAQYPKIDAGLGVSVASMPRYVVRDVSRMLYLLLAAVCLLLLIACVNVANLLLSRATSREKEMAIRGALGAGRTRVIRQLLTESVLLALCGSAFGVLLAVWGTRGLLSYVPHVLPRAGNVSVDIPVLLFAIGISVLTGLLFGLAPAMHSSRSALRNSLEEGSRGSTGGRRGLQNALVVAEVGLALVLLVGAGLTLRTILDLYHVKTGFATHGSLVVDMSLPASGYRSGPAIRGFYRNLTSAIGNLPGVRSVGATTNMPVAGGDSEMPFYVQGRPKPQPEKMPMAMYYIGTPDYMGAMGIQLLRGRFFTDQDNLQSQPVIVIDDEMARKLFRGQDPLGRHIIVSWGLLAAPREIVGVVHHVKHYGPVGAAGEKWVQTLDGAMYIPFAQLPDKAFKESGAANLTLVIRTSVSPGSIVSSVRHAIRSVDPRVAIMNVNTMGDLIQMSLAAQRLTALLFGIFALLALILAAVGIYGVISYAAAQRTHEIGIRMALGAQKTDVFRLVVSQAITPVVIGLGAGILAAVGLTRFLSSMLYGVKPTDPLTFIAVSMILGAVALAASYIPARRAAKVDPMEALRYE